MSYKAYIYSIDENIKISHLKSWEYPLGIETANIEKYIYDNKIQILSQDEDYHSKFLAIPSKPYIIYAIGNLDLLNSKIIWMVWPRKPSEYATKIISQTISLLSCKQNISTISGLAEGIDELVHNESIKNNIPTIAVLGWGLGYFLTWTRRDLIHKIIDNWWLVISEFRLKQKPAPWTFPQRNRIVAWLSDMIFLAEASDNSGSLITVNFALEMKKLVFIVPGNIYSSTSFWSNKLLNHSGTKAVYDLQARVDDNFEKSDNNTKIEVIDKNKYNNLTVLQKDILQYISDWADNIDKILTQNANLDYNTVIFELSMLEIDWYIYSPIPGKIAIK